LKLLLPPGSKRFFVLEFKFSYGSFYFVTFFSYLILLPARDFEFYFIVGDFNFIFLHPLILSAGWEAVVAAQEAAKAKPASGQGKDALSLVVLDASANEETLPERKHRTDVQPTPA
jgi:hypothetical protein